jgi:thioredoxin reductase (NADPH)
VDAVEKTPAGDFTVATALGRTFRAPAVIITAGGTPNKLNVPGEQEYAGRGVSYCAVCDGAFFKGETIAVVGGGDAAVEEAEYLTRYAQKVYIVHRRDQLRASPIIQERAFRNPRIEMVWNRIVLEIQGDARGAQALRLRDTLSGEESSLAVTGCFIFIGFTPNTGMIKGHYRHDAAGYVITDDHMMTDIPGLFAAGDLRVQLTRQVTTAVGDATTAAIAVQKYLAEIKEREGSGVGVT